MREICNLEAELELFNHGSTAFIFQLKREAIDIPAILTAHPRAVVQSIVESNGHR